MTSLTINIKDDTITEKVLWLLDHFKSDGLEIVSQEDNEDLKLLKATRKEEVVNNVKAAEERIKNGDYLTKEAYEQEMKAFFDTMQR